MFAIDPTVQDVLRKMAAPTGPSMQEIVIFLIVEGSDSDGDLAVRSG